MTAPAPLGTPDGVPHRPELVAADGGHALRLAAPLGAPGALVFSSIAVRMGTHGPMASIPIVEASVTESTVELRGQEGSLAATARWRRVDGPAAHWYVDLRVVNHGSDPVSLGLRVEASLEGPGDPTWLIPACFYGENRPERCARIYPRYARGPTDIVSMTSEHWSFRADRAALPAVFAWNDVLCAALSADAELAAGSRLIGVGFAGPGATPDGSPRIHLDVPYREEPLRYDGSPRAQPADVGLTELPPGGQLDVPFRVHVTGPDRHAYDPLVRRLYAELAQRNPLRPWVSTEHAARLAAHGLHRWHYRPESGVLYETAAFDREANHNAHDLLDRPRMHVAWVSGVPYAGALLAEGRRTSTQQYVDAGRAVLDTVAGGLAPSGLLWGEWRPEGWRAGWNRDPAWLHVRTIGEAVLFLVRAISAERTAGAEVPAAWRDVVRSNLVAILRAQRPDGNLGTYHHARTGEVVEWDGAGGLIWVPALLEARAVLADDPADGDPSSEVLLDAARRAGRHYARYVEQELLYGAPEDIHLAPSSEDGYNAIMAYVALHEADPVQASAADRRSWLDLARRSADWTMTFRWAYDIAFDPHTILGRYGFASRGADGASPSNQHLGAYGLMCVPELFRLARYTGDGYYHDRALDNLACYRQFIARMDGDFDAYRGMVTERIYHTDCFQAKGMLLTLSHAWSVGAVLLGAHAALRYLEDPDALPA